MKEKSDVSFGVFRQAPTCAWWNGRTGDITDEGWHRCWLMAASQKSLWITIERAPCYTTS